MKTVELEAIDISCFIDGSSSKELVTSAVGKACQTKGIFAVTGHGISQKLIENCFKVTAQFFTQPTHLKELIPIASLLPPRGYFPHGVYVTKLAETPKIIEVRENFIFCISSANQLSTQPNESEEFFQPVTWPQSVTGFKESFLAFNAAMGGLSYKLWSIFACALGLPENYFLTLTTNPISFVVLNYYKHIENWTPAYGDLRMGEHTDITNFTLILPEAAKDGFQIELENGEWADVTVAPDAIIVQMGNLMEIWTNGQWKASKHRVAAPTPFQPDNSRISMVFGVQTNCEAEISCLDTCLATSAKYQPTTCGQYEKAVFGKAIQRINS
jgi:isopenicillin N synthase-like dioxygenase